MRIEFIDLRSEKFMEQTWTDIDSYEKMWKIVNPASDDINEMRMEDIAALCLEINTWQIFVFFWGKHDGNKSRTSKEDLRH